jgi:hypothetical protein
MTICFFAFSFSSISFVALCRWAREHIINMWLMKATRSKIERLAVRHAKHKKMKHDGWITELNYFWSTSMYLKDIRWTCAMYKQLTRIVIAKRDFLIFFLSSQYYMLYRLFSHIMYEMISLNNCRSCWLNMIH